jgi:hypothetical protein
MFEKSFYSLFLLRFSLGGWFCYGCIFADEGEDSLLYDMADLWRQGVAFVRMLFCWYDTLECFS